MTTDNLPENFGQDEDLENEISNFIVLTDEDDNDTTFELLAIMEYEEKNYVVLYPVDDEEEDSALVILEAVGECSDEDAFEAYLPVEDDDLLQDIFSSFCAEFPEYFEDEE